MFNPYGNPLGVLCGWIQHLFMPADEGSLWKGGPSDQGPGSTPRG